MAEHRERAEVVGINILPEQADIAGEQTTRRQYTSIVDQEVDIGGSVSGGLHVLQVRDIELQRDDSRRVERDDRLQERGIACCGIDPPCSTLKERLNKCASDTT